MHRDPTAGVQRQSAALSAADQQQCGRRQRELDRGDGGVLGRRSQGSARLQCHLDALHQLHQTQVGPAFRALSSLLWTSS